MARPIPDLDEMTAAEVATDDSIIIDDTSAGETKRIDVGELLGLPSVGWTASGEIWTFSSFVTASTMAVVNVPTNALNKYAIGMFVRFSQATGGTKYGKIVAMTSTTLTLWTYGYTVLNETITAPMYSPLAHPQGLPTTIADGNPYQFSAYCSTPSPNSISTVETAYSYNTKNFDYANSYNTSTFTYVVPVTGVYEFSNIMQSNSGFSGVVFAHLRYNGGASLKEIAVHQNGNFGVGHCYWGKIRLVAGDTVQLRTVTGGGAVGVGANLANTYTDFSGALVNPTA